MVWSTACLRSALSATGSRRVSPKRAEPALLDLLSYPKTFIVKSMYYQYVSILHTRVQGGNGGGGAPGEILYRAKPARVWTCRRP